jgi:riboflavin synthase
MFTGIIQEVGTVNSITRGVSGAVLGIRAQRVYTDAAVSDSIAVCGVCLTVTKKENGILYFDVVSSTLALSNLAKLKKGDFVNVEPALKVGDKLGGHFVLGHVDRAVRLRRAIKKSTYWQLEVNLPVLAAAGIVENGSIAIEGISLTVKKVYPRYFTLDIIPFTYEHTNIKYKKPGDWLNIEFDYLLKEAGQKNSK